MTVAQLAIDYRSFLSPHTDRGVSDEATTMNSRFRDVIRELLSSITLGGCYFETLGALEDAFVESSSENWDSYGAMAVSPITYSHARRLLLALPTTLPVPDIAVEPDGEFAFEWFRGLRRVFSVSVGRDNELTYAGLFGRSKVHGTEYFADELPKPIIENLVRLFSQAS